MDTFYKRLKPESYKNTEIPPYSPSVEVVNAVNLAIMTGRPLLVMGEPGSGKTALAIDVAFALHGADFKNAYREWHVKSTTTLKDGLYQLDPLRRLIDAQSSDEEDIKAAKNITHERYFTSGPLLEIFQIANAMEKNMSPAVLLIDEIDKAPLDFPNDLLRELDKKELYVDIKKENVAAQPEKLLIIVTSNREKELPSAFLRRCIFQETKFPDESSLKEIVKSRFKEGLLEDDMLKKLIHKFMELRETNNKQVHGQKKISTSEMLDWFTAIHQIMKLENTRQHHSDAERQLVFEWQNFIQKDSNDRLPFLQTLIKTL